MICAITRAGVALAVLLPLLTVACSDDSAAPGDDTTQRRDAGASEMGPSDADIQPPAELGLDAPPLPDQTSDLPPCAPQTIPTAPTPSPLTSPTSLVPRIATGGQGEGFFPPTDDSGLTAKVERPTVVCGLGGSIEERIGDCQCRNPTTAAVVDTEEPKRHSWSLVVLGTDGSEVWRDNLTGYIWSDRIGWDSDEVTEKYFNWCRAAGSNNKVGSPYAEDDPHGICTNVQYQSASSPVSVCAEDPVHLNGTTTSAPAKGGLGKLPGATTDLVWWLPSMTRYRRAYAHGASKVMPRSFTQGWSRLMDSYDRKNAWVFTTENRVSKRSSNTFVRCVGAM